uniref:Ribosomal protein S16 n=1 Tax=Hagenia abyssinica TaxID=57921 RepID=A0A1B2FKK0_9ROSA|nr:ribosomal protein S16 [Hagenia abyssinica]QTX96705.1 ribosomal protein S16 [Agrimonia pilosa var. nepalensis]
MKYQKGFSFELFQSYPT